MQYKLRSFSFSSMSFVDVYIEISVFTRGLPGITILGNITSATHSSKLRVVAGLKNSGIKLPPKKIYVSFSPASTKITGAYCDMAICAGLISYVYNIPFSFNAVIFCGELSTTGAFTCSIPVATALAYCIDQKIGRLVVACSPSNDILRLANSYNVSVFLVENLLQLRQFLLNNLSHLVFTSSLSSIDASFGDDVLGHTEAKKALFVSACGAHSTLLFGPPGVGKTTLCSSFKNLLPPLSARDHLGVIRTYSFSQVLSEDVLSHNTPPFYQVFFSDSLNMSVKNPNTHSFTLSCKMAQNGILFLDEICLFPRKFLEALRINLDLIYDNDSQVGNFTLLATSNPCPCGFLNDAHSSCTCTVSALANFKKKIQGPLLDRISIVKGVYPMELFSQGAHRGDTYARVYTREEVAKVREFQLRRSKKLFGEILLNSMLSFKHLQKLCAQSILNLLHQQSINTHSPLSPRAYINVLRVARTIADVSSEDLIKEAHIYEALLLRETF